MLIDSDLEISDRMKLIDMISDFIDDLEGFALGATDELIIEFADAVSSSIRIELNVIIESTSV